MENEKKCNKYESLFVFQNEVTFNEHLQNCPECQAEHEKYLKVSKLVKEVAPMYLKKKQKAKVSAIKRLACCFVLFVGLTAYTGYQIYDDYSINTDYDSYITTMGLPTDEYGFLDL